MLCPKQIESFKYQMNDFTHPNVLHHVEFFRANGRLCVVLEDCKLGKLATLIKKLGNELFEENEVSRGRIGIIYQ